MSKMSELASQLEDIQVGKRISCRTWHELMVKAFYLSSIGYGVAVNGFKDMSENTLTITALPEKNDQVPDMRVTIEEAAEAIQKLFTGPGISQKDIEDGELISRQVALKKLKESAEHHANDSREEALLRRDRDIIRALPPVTPQPKTGHWIVDGSVDCYLDKVRCHCSECGKKKEFPADFDPIKQKLSISYKYLEFIDNFCSKCGAKMVVLQEGSEE